MARLKRIVLDVLKPHQPGVLDFARALAALGDDYRVFIDVAEVDEKTESVVIDVRGADLDFESIAQAIRELGGTVHSVDRVLMTGDGADRD